MKVKTLIAAAAVAVAIVLPSTPARAADCTEDLGMCVRKASCSVAGAVNKLGNKVGTGDLVYCLY
ncbi:MAG TPA: hypothetical protein VM573_02660 [Actinomycetota bacterium]|nr:hypothetical protein [Actinomycetota bacterium]